MKTPTSHQVLLLGVNRVKGKLNIEFTFCLLPLRVPSVVFY